MAGIGPGAAFEFGSDPADPVAMFAVAEPDGACGVPRVGGLTGCERPVDG